MPLPLYCCCCPRDSSCSDIEEQLTAPARDIPSCIEEAHQEDSPTYSVESKLRLGDGMPLAQEYSVILLDAVVDSPLYDRLQEMNDLCLHYTTVEQCADYIQATNEKIFVVTTSGENVELLLNRCGKLKHLKSVYVRDSTTAPKADTRVNYFADSTNLIQQIEQDVKPLKQKLVAFHFFHANQKTLRDLTSEAASFMWSQMLIDVLRQIPTSARTMADMIKMCQDYHQDNPEEMEHIEEFRNSYQPYEAIKWYTRGCFLFHLLNKAIRTEDTDALHLFRAYIVDLSMQLEEEQRKNPPSTWVSNFRPIASHARILLFLSIVVFRGQISIRKLNCIAAETCWKS